MFEWYVPWSSIDWILKLQMLIWVASIACSYYIAWRTLIRKRPWLRGRDRK